MNILQRIFGFGKNYSNLNWNDLRFLEGETNHVISLYSKHGIYEMYEKNSIFRAIIEKQADAFSRCNYYVTDSKGKEIQVSNSLLPFLNPIRNTSEQFKKNFLIQYQLYDKVVILKEYGKTFGIFKDSSKVRILDYLNCNIIYKRNYSIYDSNIIDYIEYTENSTTINLEPSQFTIVHKYELKPEEKFTITSLDKSLNIIYTALCIILNFQKKTQFGMLTPKSDTEVGNEVQKGVYSRNKSYTGLDEEEQKQAQELLRKFSALSASSGDSIMVTRRAMDYKDLMPKIETMLLTEHTANAIKDVCSLLNFPVTSLNYLDSKYSDKELFSKELYTEGIIPLWNLYEQTLNNLYVSESGNNYKNDIIKLDYSFIEALQKDKKTYFETNSIELDNILKLCKSIAMGEITFDKAVNLLVYQGYDKALAESILTNNIIQNGSNNNT